LITGQVPSVVGTVQIGEADIANYSPRDAMAAGMAFVAADRARQGNFAMLSVTANTTVSNVKRNVRSGRLVHSLEHAESNEWISTLRTKTAGGLRLEPSVIVLDEPTRGIDVGAKEEIHSLIDQAATNGSAVLVASTDTEELVRVSHRILILRGGIIAAELTGSDITVENIERAQLQQKVAQS
jgi:ABC-type sugar transport system ATPase subunit